MTSTLPQLCILFLIVAASTQITVISAGKSTYVLCKEKNSLSKDIQIEISNCESKERCPLYRGQNTTMSVTFTPIQDSLKGIERILTGKFVAVKNRKIVELPMLKPIDAGKETLRMGDNIPAAQVPIKKHLKYNTKFTYAVPVTAAKGPFDLRLILREKVNGTKSWKNNTGAVYVCVMVPLQYA